MKPTVTIEPGQLHEYVLYATMLKKKRWGFVHVVQPQKQKIGYLTYNEPDDTYYFLPHWALESIREEFMKQILGHITTLRKKKKR